MFIYFLNPFVCIFKCWEVFYFHILSVIENYLFTSFTLTVHPVIRRVSAEKKSQKVPKSIIDGKLLAVFIFFVLNQATSTDYSS